MIVEKRLLFVSHNAGKIKEIRALLPPAYTLIGLAEAGWHEDIPEPFATFEENATAKATAVFYKTGIPCFADDSGLLIAALGGRPGVHSARYAGDHKSSADNMAKVLDEMRHAQDRRAKFVAVIAYCHGENQVQTFRGELYGSIAHVASGEGGFGYDPVFIPDGFDQTLGQLPAAVKNTFSHRSKALAKFLESLGG